jgi:hypothetical protein
MIVRKTTRVLTLVLFCLLAFGAMAWAEEPAKGDKKGPAEPDFGFTVGGGFLGASDIGSGSGSASVSRFDTELKAWKFSLGYDHDAYSWDRKEELPFGNGVHDPWSDLKTLSLKFNHGGRLSDSWGYFMAAGVSSSYESELGPAAYSAMAGGRYRLSPKSSLTLGLGGSYHELESAVLPMVGFNYNASGGEGDGTGWYFSVGFPHTHVGYKANEWLGFRATFLADHGLYKLADANPIAAEGYVKQTGYGTGAFVDLTPSDNISVSIGAYYMFAREWELFDRHEASLGSYDVDNALGGRLEVSFSF